MSKCSTTTAAKAAGLIVCTLLLATPALGNTLTATSTADNGPGSLREAIAVASAGDTISVIVTGTITLTTGPLLIRKDLTIVGPGSSMLAIDGTSASRVLTVGDTVAVKVTISGVTIQNGYGDYGGGIFNGGTLTITESGLSGNAAAFNGGAIFNRGTLTLSNSSVSGNSAGFYGGGLYSETGSRSTVTGTLFSSNSALVGGGMTNHDGTLSVRSSTVWGNFAGNPYGGSGGGIYNGGFYGIVDVASSTVAHNVATAQGSGIYSGSGQLTVVSSTVSNNSSPCNAGGCSGGGGIYLHSSTAVISDSTLFDNVSQFGGNLTSLYSITTVKNSILAKGSSGLNCYTYTTNAIVSAGYNLSDDPSCATFFTHPGDLNNVPAGLSPDGLRDNGGPTQTIALLPASLAVDGVPLGACTDATGSVRPDQRDVARPQAAACDIGAVEMVFRFRPTTLSLAPPDPDSLFVGSSDPVRLTALLTDPETGSPISGARVAFHIDGTPAGTMTTAADGTAMLAYNASQLTAGGHIVQAFLARQTVGDSTFEASSSATRTFQLEPSPYAVEVQSPIRADGMSVFHVKRGVVPVKFVLFYNGVATCQLPTATIALFQTAGTVAGFVSETVYALQADSGSNFRVDTNACQYVYNLATDSLGTGSYVVLIRIGGINVGGGRFGLQ